jgi:structure-specific endonuclease subunit SLX1
MRLTSGQWAWQNPGATRHLGGLAPRARRPAAPSTAGPPAPPPSLSHPLARRLADLHRLLCSRAFARQPLLVRFLSRAAHRYWLLWDERSSEHLPRELRVEVDLDDGAPPGEGGAELVLPAPLARVDVRYAGMAGPLHRAVERLGAAGGVACRACRARVDAARELVVVCPTDGCSAALHLACAAGSGGVDDGHVVPLQFKCTSCFGTADWAALVKEASVRAYGGTLVDKILKCRDKTETVWMDLGESDGEESDSSSGKSLVLVDNPSQW